jgi:hypothetical protein
MPDMLRLQLEDGKYTIIQTEDGSSSLVLRYGDSWVDSLAMVPMGKMVLGMGYRIEELQENEKLLVGMLKDALWILDEANRNLKINYWDQRKLESFHERFKPFNESLAP